MNSVIKCSITLICIIAIITIITIILNMLWFNLLEHYHVYDNGVLVGVV